MSEGKKELILVVDDNPQNIQLLGGIIKAEKYELAFATKGQEALDYMKDEKPDLVLLDVMMPEMDGYEVCRRMKQDASLKSIPVIFLTARKEVEDIVKGFEVGGVDYVIKPFHAVELMARVETHLEIKRSREEIKTLRGIIPICANCKSIRDDTGYWSQVEEYIEKQTEAQFSHSLCESCSEELYGNEPWYRKLKEKRNNNN